MCTNAVTHTGKLSNKICAKWHLSFRAAGGKYVVRAARVCKKYIPHTHASVLSPFSFAFKAPEALARKQKGKVKDFYRPFAYDATNQL